MAYSRSPIRRTGTLLFINIIFIILLLAVLHLFKIVDFTALFKYIPFIGSKSKFTPGQRIEDPNLLEREELMKHWQILSLREQLYQQRLIEITKRDREATARFEQVEQQRRELEERTRALQERRISEESRQQNIKYLANKFANMPPKDTVNVMINMDNVIVIDVLKQMDKDATENGVQSIVPYLITLMSQKDAAKAAEISRLISRYPTDAEARENTEPQGEIQELPGSRNDILREFQRLRQQGADQQSTGQQGQQQQNLQQSGQQPGQTTQPPQVPAQGTGQQPQGVQQQPQGAGQQPTQAVPAGQNQPQPGAGQ